MNTKRKYLIIVAVLAISACSSDRSAVVTNQQVSVFENEVDAAYESSLNREPVQPLATLHKGEEVVVLEDTYGKDYWACKVKLKNNTTGWALCTSLQFKGGS